MKKIIRQKSTKAKAAKAEVKPKAAVPKKAVRPKAAIAQFGLHMLKAPFGSHKKRKYLGRGSSSGHGKTSTRGSKGQTSRAGRHFYLGFEGGQTPLIRRIPKRGFTNKFKKEFQLVNLRDLNTIKESTINPALLEERGLIKNKAKLIKILGDGQIEKAVAVQAHAFSKHAAEAIVKAGGKTEIIHV
jgi:large subunit ribosomal protein L15